MSNEITRFTPTGTTSRLEPENELKAGQYWRTRHDVPAREESYERERNPWFYERETAELNADGKIVETRTTVERDAIPADTVLLVKTLRIVDDELHTVILAEHPRSGRGRELRFLAAEFFEHFSFAPDAEEVREREIAEVRGEIKALQGEIAASGSFLPRQSTSAAGDVTALVKASADADEHHAQAAQQLVVANERKSWLQSKSGEIKSKSELLASFFQEKADAAIANIDGVIRDISTIERGVRSLKIYAGDDVHIDTVRKGADAPADAPLTIYQRRLFLDEELGVLLAQGGIDSDSFGKLEGFIEQNPDFINRVAPAPRSIVLMSLRRQARVDEKVESIAEAFAAVAKARADRQGFLLARNGDNIHLIWSDVIWSMDGKRDDFDANGLKRLFPMSTDLSEPFKGVDGREITLKSLDYTDARQRFDDRALAYKRLLILLMGIQERTRLFGSFYDETKYESWADLTFQQDHFNFLADEAMGLAEDRPDLRTYFRDANRWLRAGSRAAIAVPRLMTRKIAPACFRYVERVGEYEQTHSPGSDWVISDVRDKNGKLVAQVPVVDLHWKRQGQGKNTAVFLNAADGARDFAFICIDNLRLDEIERYIDSRRDRENYADYLGLFSEIRTLLIAERTALAPARQAILALAAQKTPEGEAAEELADDAIRLWRGAHQWKLPPMPGESRRFDAEIAAIIEALTKPKAHFEVLGRNVAAASGRDLIRVSVTGNGDLSINMTPKPEETIDTFGMHPWTFVRTVPFSEPLAKGEEGLRVIEDHDAALSPAFDTPLAAGWLERRAPHNLQYAEARQLCADIAASGAFVDLIKSGSTDPDLFRTTVSRMFAKRDGYIENVVNRVPVAIVKTYGGRFGILYLAEDPLLIFARGSDANLVQVEALIKSRYQHPQRALERIRQALPLPGEKLEFSTIQTWRTRLSTDPNHDRTELSGIYHRGWGAHLKIRNWREHSFDAGEYVEYKDEKGHTLQRRATIAESLALVNEDVAAFLDEAFAPADAPGPNVPG